MIIQPIWQSLNRKLVAILRGIEPAETAAIVSSLIDLGFEAIEIPLNSPDPFTSIATAVKVAKAKKPEGCFIGAGTVLTVDEVNKIRDCGGNLIVSPNANPDVISATVANGMFSMPGVLTPTDAHSALAAGASVLKFFPASVLGPSGIKAIKAILPKDLEICAVGGVGPGNFADYLGAGVNGFGIGSNLYSAGLSLEEIEKRAKEIMAAYDKVTAG